MAADSKPLGAKDTCNVENIGQGAVIQSSIAQSSPELGSSSGREDMNIVIVGHVDHGKSTVIGRLLADTDSLPQGKLEAVREFCRRNSKPFEYAFLLDAMKDEQAQGITIDSARVFFKSAKRHYIIIDAPGHIEFMKNMVTGASRAEAALLVIDATEGIQENSKRHGFMLSMLGVKQITVLINKMDLVGYEKSVFDLLSKQYRAFLETVGIEPAAFIPVSGREGDHIVGPSEKMPWYRGPSVLEALDQFQAEPLPVDQPFRMSVQGVYRFTQGGDQRRIVAGTITSGRLRVGDTVVFYPSGKRSRVKTIEAFNVDPLPTEAIAGSATGFTLDEQIYIRRGEIAVKADEERPRVTTRMRVNLFWLGQEPMIMGKRYLLKLGTAKVGVEIEEIRTVLDSATLSKDDNKKHIDRNDVAECILRMDSAVALDEVDRLAHGSRFVIVDEYEISGGGIVEEALEDSQSWVRQKVLVRNERWVTGQISAEERAKKYGHRPALVLITGQEDVGKKPIARALEKHLFEEGRLVYFLGIGNVLYGVDADIKGALPIRPDEHIRRLGEVAHVMLDAGMILIVTAIELAQSDVDLIRTAIGPERLEVIWVGPEVTTDVRFTRRVENFNSPEDAARQIAADLENTK